jgi:serine/threonine-protein kinase/endoribonuclease IRE1
LSGLEGKTFTYKKLFHLIVRPKAIEVLHHPLFWSSEMKLSFLRDVSDRVELEDREANSVLLNVLESTAPVALGGKWDEKMEPTFLANIGRYRRYKFDSVRDLLRVMRNKLNHYRELPLEIQVSSWTSIFAFFFSFFIWSSVRLV